MKTKLLPASTGTYRIINKVELSEEQRNVLKVAGSQHVLERLCALIGDGKVSVTQVQARYGALMREVGES
jgi:hypothetical protein